MNFLADAGVANVGTEAFSIDNPAATLPDADPPYPAHQVCRDRKVLNTERVRSRTGTIPSDPSRTSCSPPATPPLVEHSNIKPTLAGRADWK